MRLTQAVSRNERQNRPVIEAVDPADWLVAMNMHDLSSLRKGIAIRIEDARDR